MPYHRQRSLGSPFLRSVMSEWLICPKCLLRRPWRRDGRWRDVGDRVSWYDFKSITLYPTSLRYPSPWSYTSSVSGYSVMDLKSWPYSYRVTKRKTGISGLRDAGSLLNTISLHGWIHTALPIRQRVVNHEGWSGNGVIGRRESRVSEGTEDGSNQSLVPHLCSSSWS